MKHEIDGIPLSNIIDTISGSLYWKNKDGVYLGCNLIGAKLAGFNSPDDVLGKTDFDLLPQNAAEAFRKNDVEVMTQEKEISFEEECCLDDGKITILLSYKRPLYDKNSKMVGIVGNSVDITLLKDAERLKLENEVQKAKIAEQEQFRKTAGQVVHDIHSPLTGLKMLLSAYEKDLPEEIRIPLREAAISIGDIANGLLCKYKKEENSLHDGQEKRQPMLVSLSLLQMLAEKKYQYQNTPISFNHNFEQNSYFVFVNAEPVAFRRMLSNIVNNAVDAFEGKEGEVRLMLKVDSEQVSIIIEDNGKGMPPEVLNKIMHNMAVTSGKENGHGIGYTQIRDTIRRNEGKLSISSSIGKGTTVVLEFAKVESPEWIAEEIILNKDDTVIILDDDSSIHGAWEARFKFCAPEIPLKHFTLGKEAIEFINQTLAKDKLLLLTDFELLKQELNGLHVIEQTQLQRSVLVTSHHANNNVRRLAEKVGIKILPKQMASEVSIQVLSKKAEMPIVDLVILDDNKGFLKAVALSLKEKKKIDTYHDPWVLLENIAKYSKNTKICVDYDLHSSINGFDVAKQLHELGYTRLHLMTGTEFSPNEIPDYLSLISKGDTDGLLSRLIE